MSPSEGAAASDELRRSLQRVIAGEVAPVFHFQPIADLRGVSVAGYEALVRLPVPAGYSPGACFDAAERFGLRIDLETVVVWAALQAQKHLPRNTFLSLNVTPAFLCSDAWDLLRARAGSLSGVVVEITEGEVIEDYERIRGCAAKVIANGGMIAIDDAGAGYASLKHILELRPSFIKLDGALVRDCDADRAKSALIETLGEAAGRMDAWVVTEGVETAQELAELVRLRVPLAQGYFLGRPAPALQQISHAAAQVLRNLVVAGEEATSLMWCAEPCASAVSRQQAEELMMAGQAVVVVTDGWGRPQELLERDGTRGFRKLPGPLRCHESTAIREALHRALTRTQGTRFDPIVVTNSEGKLQGIVRVDRLMLAAMEERFPQTAK